MCFVMFDKAHNNLEKVNNNKEAPSTWSLAAASWSVMSTSDQWERLRRMNVPSSSDDIQSLEPDGSWWWIIHNFLLSGSFEDDREPHEMLSFIFVTLFSPECPRAIINPVQMMEDFSWSWRKFPNCRLLLHFIFKPSIIGHLAPLKSSHWF